MKILMCPPDYFNVEYQINPWMNLNESIDHAKARKQWETLYQTLINCDAEVSLLKPVEGLPDMVFTANPGLLYQDSFILSHFKHAVRQNEVVHLKAWLTDAGFNIANPDDFASTPFFEGGGDGLIAGETLFAGYGFRSDKQFYEQASYLDQNKLVYCQLINPRFYHLDTCFCPINEDLALWYPGAFDEETQKRMAAKIELLDVGEEEAYHFACNAVVVNNHVILPGACPKTKTLLEKRGFEVSVCEMSEFLKAGGACKCMTLRLD